MRRIKLNWKGGEHEFLLRIGELRALQDACDAGPEELFNRIRLGNWRLDDLIHVLRLGLIGADQMDADDAGKFVARLFDLHPILEFKMTAHLILAQALLNPEEDSVGEEEGEASAPENGASPGSTDQGQS